MRKALLRLVVLSAPLLLSACGEGWETVRTDEYVPYGNTRTAGTGVMYVRAQMMPEKELKLEPAVEEPVAEEPQDEVQPVLDAEEIFNEAQGKGTKSSKKPAAEEHAAMDEAEEAVKEVEEELEAVEKEMEAVEEEAEAVAEEPEKESSNQATSDEKDEELAELSAEEYIQQAPKQITVPKVQIVETQPAAGAPVEEIDPVASIPVDTPTGDLTTDNSAIEGEAVVAEAETVEVYENVIVEPSKEIIAPKKDVYNPTTPGQQNLDQIYRDPFSE